MSERGDQVANPLGVLHKHSTEVADAFEGEITVESRQRAKAIEALFEAGALKPSYEDTYRLNPRLREFIADHYSSYHAYQALRGVTGTMRQAQTQWRELRRLKEKGTRRSVDTLLAALDESIADISYSIEHNLAMLYALLGNQFGNVDGLNEIRRTTCGGNRAMNCHNRLPPTLAMTMSSLLTAPRPLSH